MSRSVSIVLALSLVGCGGPDAPPVAVSATLVASSDGEALYAVDVDEGNIARVSRDGRHVSLTPAGSEPTRLTRAAGKLWVTLRGERTVVAYEEGSSRLTETARAEVGAEPYGIVASKDGSRVYVAVSLEDRVVELDGATLEPLREWEVLDEPRWLALNLNETSLFVASLRDGRFTRIDLDSGETEWIRLPTTGAGHESPNNEIDFEVRPVNDLEIELELTLTGDPALSADGDTLAVPVVYADTTTPVVTATEDEGGSTPGYASSGVGVSRFNGALVLIPLDEDGEVDGTMVPVLLAARTRAGLVRSAPTGVASDPDGRHFVVTMEGSDAALVVDSEPFRGQADDDPSRAAADDVVLEPAIGESPFAGIPPTMLGFWDRPVTALTTGRGPRGVAFVGDQLYVHAFLERQVGWLDWDDVAEVNLHAARDRKADADDEPEPVLEVRDHVLLEPSALPDDVRRGQRLFYSAIDRDITGRDSGVSCATCHVDGRADGRTWPFAGLTEGARPTLRQTPSLAGKLSETAPFTWDGSVVSITDEVTITSHDRMGGRGLDKQQLLDVVAYIDSRPAPDTADDPTDPLVLEGRAIFERADVGCASCHAGARFTDGLNHAVLGTASNTPSLTGISATAPYLHDGSAQTLRDVLVWARSGAMGDTSMLDGHELDALEAYLRSL